jgi:hypothetical protein
VSLSGLRNAMRAASKQVAAREAARAANSPEAWRALWENSLREFYPECFTSYPDYCAIQLKRAVEKRGLPREDMPSFLPWLIEQWQVIRCTVFSFNGKPYGPEVPDMKWVIRYVGQLHARYTARRPDVAPSLPLAKRLAPLNPACPPAKPKNAPAGHYVPIKAPLNPFTIDHERARAVQKKLNLPIWD